MFRISSITLLSVILLISTSSTLAANPVSVTVDFNNHLFVSNTTATYQIVVNPLLSRDSPIHKAVWDNLAALNAEYPRLAGWFPYPSYTVAQLQRPSGLKQCANVAEGQVLQLSCERAGNGNGKIAEIEFASYGDFTGTCGNYTMGKCNAANVSAAVEAACKGKSSCSVPANIFGDPCNGTLKGFAVQVTCDPPMNNSYWNFTYPDQIFEDFLDATVGKPSIMSYSTQPNWLYDLNGSNYHHYPDRHQVDWGYTAGLQLLDKSCKEIGEYFGRVASWYANGGFTDEYGEVHTSPYNYDIQLWEVLNEVDLEHQTSIETYTCIYDQVVTNIRKMADPQHKIKFVGLAHAYIHTDQISYFLNRSNHASPDIPLDWISYHHYASSSSRTDPNSYENFFPDYDGWVAQVAEVEKIRRALSPETRTTINELGVILQDDNNADAPQFPLIYWNAVAASYAYIFSQLTKLGIDVVGMSQMVGYPNLPDVMGGLSPQFPSVAVLNWTDGSGTARYWTLKMMIDDFQAGDILVNTTISNPDQVYAQAYLSGPSVPDRLKTKRVLLINKKNAPVSVTLSGLKRSIVKVIDLSTGFGPARHFTSKSDTIELSEFAVAVAFLQSGSSSPSSNEKMFNEELLFDI